MEAGHLFVGLTGGIACGKSTVAAYLREKGCPVINADRVGHIALNPGQPAYDQILETFGEGILTDNKEINRKALGNIIFNDRKAREQLNQITHPPITQLIEERLLDLTSFLDSGKPVFLEAALLIESQWKSRCDQIWVVTAPKDQILQRLKIRNGLTAEQTKARIDSQLRQEERLPYADVVLENQGLLADLLKQVDLALAQLQVMEN
ncbi:MAG: dephospho-CoA kinase [Deltaproteobacteria bacterium]|jgi:dephospho-CoA kinase|nr:dephospho-CoA kinase [Deltaproteobacteria bacterium]